MKSKVYVSDELDNLDLAVQELTQGLGSEFELLKNTCGILFCSSDMDHDTFLKKFTNAFPYDVIGCTCMAGMEGQKSFHDTSIILTVLTADDCEFFAGYSEPVNPDNVNHEIDSLYQKGRQTLEGRNPELVFAIPPYNLDIMLDTFTERMNEIAPGVPFVGGLPSYQGQGDFNKTFFNQTASEDRMVMLMISGNIKPVFSIQSVTSSPVERKRQVTSAKDNVVYKVGSQTFVEYLREIGIPVQNMIEGNNSITFVSNPILLENVNRKDEGSYAFVRTLHKVCAEDGSGTAIGAIPNGATLSICTLRSDQIEDAAIKGIEDITAKMQDAGKGYQYSIIFAISCIGRYLLLVPRNSAEADKLLSKLPEGINLSGFYSYGEISPIMSKRGEMINFAHNESLVLCAI